MRLKALARKAIGAVKRTPGATLARDLWGEFEPTRELLFPFKPESRSWMIGQRRGDPTWRSPHQLPVPPRELWVGYSSVAADYLEGGRQHVAHMRRTLEQHGVDLTQAGRILELGCAAARMLRWMVDLAGDCDLWGVDISAAHVLWCRQHLSPPMHFATTTMVPHLPFEDRSFGLVYAGSVFTHLDDLADAWFLEVHRILRPGGVLYATVHDRETIRILTEEEPDNGFARYLSCCPEFAEFAAQDFGMFTVGRFAKSQIFYDTDDLLAGLRGLFDVITVEPRAYGYQTALVLRRAADRGQAPPAA